MFTDVASVAGIQFRHGHATKRPPTILEATGSGCAFLDYDNDNWPDLFFAGQPRCALYHNNRNGTFTDVTRAAGLSRPGYWIGCGAGDYDNDGHVDLFVTGYNTCALYHNNGSGGFADVTTRAGIRARGWQTSCAFGDLDRDGWLDLYICRYLQFGPRDPQLCTYANTTLKATCSPDVYEPQVGVFYRNCGNGTFAEATKAFGLDCAHGKAWGVVFGDYDGDGWTDMYVANDEMPGDLLHNTGGGRMENRGVASGTGYSQDGSVQGGMGADFGDYDNDGRPDLVVTTFWMEPDSLYHNEGRGLFSPVSYAVGIAAATFKRVGFGTKLVDLDNDGWLDLFLLNGHVLDAHAVNPDEEMAQPMQLFLNEVGRRFRDVSADAGDPFHRRLVGRGAAFGDYDNDGCVDVAAIDAEGAALLLHNGGPAAPAHRGHWLTVRAVTASGSRDALGAKVTVVAGGRQQTRELQSSGSVLSANDPRAHFGLGPSNRVDRLVIRWPDGTTETIPEVAADRVIVVREGSGIIEGSAAPHHSAGAV